MMEVSQERHYSNHGYWKATKPQQKQRYQEAEQARTKKTNSCGV